MFYPPAQGSGNRLPHPTARKQGPAERQIRRVTFAPYATSNALDRSVVILTDIASAAWVAERCGETIALETDTPRLALDLALKGLGRAKPPAFVRDVQAGLERGADNRRTGPRSVARSP